MQRDCLMIPCVSVLWSASPSVLEESGGSRECWQCRGSSRVSGRVGLRISRLSERDSVFTVSLGESGNRTLPRVSWRVRNFKKGKIPRESGRPDSPGETLFFQALQDTRDARPRVLESLEKHSLSWRVGDHWIPGSPGQSGLRPTVLGQSGRYFEQSPRTIGTLFQTES